ncbi:hypothetical protein LINGRAHAP2_LOCUS8959 [Linum grandiflorum]
MVQCARARVRATCWVLCDFTEAVDIEGYATSAAAHVPQGHSLLVAGGAVMQDVVHLIVAPFGFRLQKVCCSANKIAHSIARLGLRYLPSPRGVTGGPHTLGIDFTVFYSQSSHGAI